MDCLFGIMKKRFLILGVASLSHFAENINIVVKVCSVLHNMLLEFDGLDTAGDNATDWSLVYEVEARTHRMKLAEMPTFVVGSQALEK